MKALVIRQPWAWAIMEGHKRIENRTWTTRYRGPLAIIAGRSTASLSRGSLFCQSHGIVVPSSLPFGSILGVVTLVDVVSQNDLYDPFAEGPYCWVLSDPVKLERPVPYRGRLGLFDLPIVALQTENR